MRALGSKLLIKHKLYDTGQLGRFEGENYKFKNRPGEEVEVTVENGYITKIKFLSDNTYADKIARIYNSQWELVGATRRLGAKIKDLKNNTVFISLNKRGGVPVSEASGARLGWGKVYTHYDGRKFDLAGKEVKLTINNGIVVKVVLIEHDLELPLNVVYELNTHFPVYSSVSKITKERMDAFDGYYVCSRLSSDGTLEAGGRVWCTLSEYPNARIKYFIKQGWVSKVEVYDDENILSREKYIHLVYDKQSKVVDFMRSINLRDISKLSDHTIDYVLSSGFIFISNEKESQKFISKKKISLQKILPPDTKYPVEGRLVIKNGIIDSFESELAETDNFYYALQSKTKKVLFYFNGIGKDVFNQLDNITIVKKITKTTDGGVLSVGARSVYIKFPEWAVGSWVMFDIKKGKKVTEVRFLKSKDHRDILKNVDGIPVVYKKEGQKGRWQLSCSVKELPAQIKAQVKKTEKKRSANLPKSRQPFVNHAPKKSGQEVDQREKNFMLLTARMFNRADQQIIASLYQKSKAKGFNLEEFSVLKNVARLLKFALKYRIAEDAYILDFRKRLISRLSFLDRAYIILSDREYEIFDEMFGQIKQIYVQYKQGGYDRDEALNKAKDIFKGWAETVEVHNNSAMGEKVFIDVLAGHLMRIFFLQKKASFDQVQKKLKEFDVELIYLNDPEFINSRENLERIKKLNNELSEMGWEIRFMKNDANYKSKKAGSHYMSIDMLMSLAEFLKDNDMDFYIVKNGGYKDLSEAKRKQFERKFGFKWRELLHQAIIGNLRMIEAKEQKIVLDVFNKWFDDLKGVKAQVVKYKKNVGRENLNLIFDKDFLDDKDKLIGNQGKALPGFMNRYNCIEKAI